MQWKLLLTQRLVCMLYLNRILHHLETWCRRVTCAADSNKYRCEWKYRWETSRLRTKWGWLPQGWGGGGARAPHPHQPCWVWTCQFDPLRSAHKHDLLPTVLCVTFLRYVSSWCKAAYFWLLANHGLCLQTTLTRSRCLLRVHVDCHAITLIATRSRCLLRVHVICHALTLSATCSRGLPRVHVVCYMFTLIATRSRWLPLVHITDAYCFHTSFMAHLVVIHWFWSNCWPRHTSALL